MHYPALKKLTPHELAAFSPAPDATVIEPTKGPWKNNVNWGNTRKEPMPLEAGAELAIFDGDHIVGPPRVQTVQLFRDDNRVGQNADYRAHIYWGVGAAQNEMFCDWSQGTQISLAANWVRVNAVTYTPLAFAPYNPAGGMVQIGANVVEGNVGKGRAATFTEPTVLVADNATTPNYEAPDFARGVLVHVRSDTPIVPGVPINVDLLTSSIAGAFLDRIDASLTYPDGVTFPGNATLALAFNHSGDTQMITVQWILSL